MRMAHRSLLVCTLMLVPAARAAAQPFAYVANRGGASVSVIDVQSNSVVKTLPVGVDPWGVAVDPATSRAYVTNQQQVGTVSVIDGTSNLVVGTIAVGKEPTGIAVKLPGTKLYVANRLDKSVSVVDLATGTVIDTIAVGNNPLGVAVNPAGTPAYVVNKGSNSVSVIDTNTDQVIATADVRNEPRQVAVHPNGRWVYVSNAGSSRVSVIDAATNTEVATIDVGSNPEGVAVHPDGTRLYVANEGPDTVSIVNTATNLVTKTVAVGTNPTDLVVTPDGTRVYVANRLGADVSVIDTATETVVDTIKVGSAPAGMGQSVRPALLPPLFGARVLACQAALAKAAAKAASVEQSQRGTCLQRVLAAESAGSGMAQAQAACAAALNAADPRSKLAKARAAAAAQIGKKCAGLVPQDVHGPCKRDAASFAQTASCLLERDAARVADMIDATFGDAGAALDKVGLKCQRTLAGEARKLADGAQAAFARCLDEVLKARSTGRGGDRAVGKCFGALDLGNPASKLAKTRGRALVKIVSTCAGVAPETLGPPCLDGPGDIPAVASCVLAQHLDAAGRLTAARYNDACTVLSGLGLGLQHAAICAGP